MSTHSSSSTSSSLSSSITSGAAVPHMRASSGNLSNQHHHSNMANHHGGGHGYGGGGSHGGGGGGGGHGHGHSTASSSSAAYHHHNNPSSASSGHHHHHHHNQHHHSSSSGVQNKPVTGGTYAQGGGTGDGKGYTYNVHEKIDDDFHFPFCDPVEKYEKITKIGQGTFGEVFKARLKENPTKLVALKKVLMENEKEGFPITALREIKILQLLKHENVVNLYEICRTATSSGQKLSKATFYLVFEFCEHDLAGLLSNPSVHFTLAEIKKVMQQLLNGLFYIHSNKILHRDMKAANILITKTGVLKLADFGLARAYSQNQVGNKQNRYTNRVVTLWYRPPELLLGERNYGPPVDCWGAGCIMAEMWTRTPIMQGNTEQHQLTLISQLCGSITPEVWPGVENLELYNKLDIPKGLKRRVKERLKPHVRDGYALDLLDKLLNLDPARRIDADTSLNHDFFWTDPMPQDLARLLSTLNQSMFEYLAPPRRPGRPLPNHPVHPPIGHPGGHPHVMRPNQGGAGTGTEYHDRVF